MEYFYFLGRILANPFTNVFQKKLTNRHASALFVVLAAYLLLAVFSGMTLVFLPLPVLGQAFWTSMLLASAIDAVGNVFAVKSLSEIELSVFGPLNAYKPVVATVTAALLLQEFPTTLGLVGIFIVIAGSLLLNYDPRFSWADVGMQRMLKSRGFWYRLTAIFLYSVSVVYLKESILHSSPFITLLFWSLLGGSTILVLVIVAISRHKLRKNFTILKAEKTNCLGLAFFFLLTQLFTLLVFEKKLLGYSLAVFQLSALLNILLGHRIFRETNMKYKLFGTLVMVLGVVLILVQ